MEVTHLPDREGIGIKLLEFLLKDRAATYPSLHIARLMHHYMPGSH